MNKGVVIVLALILLFVGIWYFKSNKPVTPTTDNQVSQAPTNAVALDARGEFEIETSEPVYYKEVKGYFVKPKVAGEYPGVVMIHENRGLRPEIKQSAETLASRGYMVLAVNLLGGAADDQDGARELTSKFDQVEGVENMKEAAEFLWERGATKVASWGWCFGGRQSLELAMSGVPLDATVVYYGGGMATTPDKLAPIKWPVLGVFGDKDTAIPVDKVKEFESSLKTLEVENEIYIYPGVGHAFANPSGANYAPTETKDAWDKTLAFLNKHLK